jgi:glycosyltransferase involved in cell wall biosynthesis
MRLEDVSDKPPGPRRVFVLMSTYQGEQFVRQQLQSILAQLPQQGQIIVRDDGSRDRTVDEIDALNDKRIKLIRGDNLGFGASFLTLLTMVPPDADMVMFSDQDDVWLPEKIGRAWQHLGPIQDRPALYGSAQMLVDNELRPLHPTPPWPQGPSLANALTQNIITGCTAAINRQAVALLQRARVPLRVRFHDWWLYLVVSTFGTVVYDDQPTLLYRQHGANQIGHGAGWLGRQWQMGRFIWRYDWVGILLSQVAALLDHFRDELPADARGLVDLYFVRRGTRVLPAWRLVLSRRRWRQSAVEELPLRLLLLAYRLHIWPLATRRQRA